MFFCFLLWFAHKFLQPQLITAGLATSWFCQKMGAQTSLSNRRYAEAAPHMVLRRIALRVLVSKAVTLPRVAQGDSLITGHKEDLPCGHEGTIHTPPQLR